MPSHCDPISWSSSWRQEGLHCRGMPKAEENSSSYICRKRRRAAAAAVKRIPRHKLRLMAIVICPCPWCLTSKQDRWIAECSQTSHGPYGLLSSSVPFQPHVPWRIRQRLVTQCSDKRKTQSRRDKLPGQRHWLPGQLTRSNRDGGSIGNQWHTAHAGVITGENLTAAKASGGMQINPTNLSARYIWHTWTSHGVSQHHSQSWLWPTLLFRFRAKVRRIGGHKYSSLVLFYLPYSDAIPPVIAVPKLTTQPLAQSKRVSLINRLIKSNVVHMQITLQLRWCETPTFPQRQRQERPTRLHHKKKQTLRWLKQHAWYSKRFQLCSGDVRLADLLGKNFHDPATNPANVRVLEYQHLQCMVESATYIIPYPCEAWWSWFLERCSSAVNWKFVWASRKQGQQRIGRSSRTRANNKGDTKGYKIKRSEIPQYTHAPILEPQLCIMQQLTKTYIP